MSTQQAEYAVRTVCELLGVSTSGYYAWRHRAPSARSQANVRLTQRIRAIHERSRQTYGVPRITAELREDGHRVGHNRVARLMKQGRLEGISRRKKGRTTRRNPDRRPAPDLVGWSLANYLRTRLVTDALEMALSQRKPQDVIHHSDQGTQYTSIEFGLRCQRAGVRPSMGSVGDCYDNALCESFFATLECELIDRSCFRSQVEARLAVFDYIERFYNPHRRHSSLAHLSPVHYEEKHADVA